MNTNECFNILDKAGWFDGWPESARESARATIEENKQFRDEDRFPGAAMISAWGDSECIYDDDSYTEIVDEFRNSSHGFFQPTGIKEVWTDQGDGDFKIEISFECHSKVYTRQLAYSDDWLDDAIFDLINEAMAELNPPMCFLQPDVGFGQEFGFLLIPKSLIGAVIEQEILPPSEESEDPEADEDDECPSITLRELYELAVSLDNPEVFEDCCGRVPEHLIDFLRGDLHKFILAVEEGKDINAVSSNGYLTPLFIAVDDNYQEGLEWLLNHPNLEIDKVDPDGDTALSHAIEKGFPETAIRLIRAGADVNHINNAGKNLVEFATEFDNDEMVAFLKGSGVG